MSDARTITTKLWEMADKLRGTMDASEYKNYILPFMFYRYLSLSQDKFLKDNSLTDFYITENREEIDNYLEDISENKGFAIEPKYMWENLVAKIENHKIRASDFQDMFDSFNKNAKRNRVAEEDFATVFSDVNLGDSRLGSGTNERAKVLNDIVLMINEFSFKDDSGKDILGDVYEYLIGQFAASAGKKGGEFYTPYQVSQVLAKISTIGAIDDNSQFRVYDPTMGSGSLLLTVKKELPFGDREGSVEFYGQELNTTTYNLARMNLMMHGVNYRNMQLRKADTLATDWPFDERNGSQIPLKFDAVVANPPYSQNWDIKNIDREKDPRFKEFGVAPASKADYAFVLHGLYHLDGKGTMAVVLPHGVLFRGGTEGKIRKNLIDSNMLDAVIGLPANLFYGTSIPTCILVFKGRQSRERTDIFFIDASNDFEKNKNKNALNDEHIEKIIETYKDRVNVDKYAHLTTLDEIRSNDYNLNIPRYVDTFEEEEIIPLSEISQELIGIQVDIAESTSKIFEMLKMLDGETEEAREELREIVSLFQEKTKAN